MILNLAAYKFIAIDDPVAFAAEVHKHAESYALRGTVLIASEGINAFLAGTPQDVYAWLAWLGRQPGLADVRPKLSESRSNPFARLKVKVKREIIAFRRDQTSPLEVGRAQAVSVPDLARWLEQAHDDDGRPVVMLDTRNREEVGHGTFVGAITLPIDNFVDFPAAVAEHREALREATIVPFCTGGIRCEKAAHWMQQAGFERVHQLDGGILGWFEQLGGAHFSGRCFVFDERVALDSQLRPAVDE